MRVFILLALAAAVSGVYKDPNIEEGRSAMVHLFEWPWTAVAAECEDYLAPNGFGGVQISPPQEHRVIFSPEWDEDVKRPWYENYQPISYRLESRLGTRDELIDMVKRCNNVGVRIYADAVINNMCGEDAGVTIGSGGSSVNTTAYSFPDVPYSIDEFSVPEGKCPSQSGLVDDYNDAENVRNCNVFGLLDLLTNSSSVQKAIADYLNDLIGIGVAGFRIDAAKHIWPDDITSIIESLEDLNTDFFPPDTRPFIYLHVIDKDTGEAVTADEYSPIGRVTDFIYGSTVSDVFRDGGGRKIADMQLFGSWGVRLSDGDGLVFIDNYDNQRRDPRGEGILTFADGGYYEMAVAFMLSWPHGFPRVMSSYSFTQDWEGPPADANFTIFSPSFNDNGTCSEDWICEHRWRIVRNMIQWRNVAGDESVQNWASNGYHQAAFSRGDKAFIAINRDYSPIDTIIYTGLPDGTYCNLALGYFDSTDGTCTGETATVSNGATHVYVDNNSENPLFVIHVEAMVDDSSENDTEPDEDYQRTVIFFEKVTVEGQDLFLRGGIDHNVRDGCTTDADTSACAIPIIHHVGGTNYKFNNWKWGDNYLDWYGAENDQGSDNGDFAQGTPSVWTTNETAYFASVEYDGFGYADLNVWGDHYWMADILMDCSKTEDGWFELKAFLKGGEGWESDRNQWESCDGSAGGNRPRATGNHFARCGFINMFTFNGDDCQIDNFS